MKKIIITLITFALIISLCAAVAVAAGNDKATRQEELHAAAETLRSLGFTDDCEAIQALSAEWWRIEESKTMEYFGTCRITGYCNCVQCCGKWAGGATASGKMPTVNHTVAMEGLPFGTVIYIDGLGEYVVEDRGVKGKAVDVFCNNHTECYAITSSRDVWIVG